MQASPINTPNNPNETTEQTSDQSIADFGLDAVRELLQLIGQTDITEILIERGNIKLHIKRGNSAPGQTTPQALPAPNPGYTPIPASSMAKPTPHDDLANHQIEMPAGYTVTAPMVGTFYAQPSPKEQPFVREGEEVHAGDIVGIIEAMKMMNEIECEVSGRVARILAKNGQPVEYGQPLMVIEPL
ncbi:MAG: acetyl-CoA carboxylase biotin carboxyl carrier protein [Chloroflexales bacterium]|nr:acetyl-CoA carboxylase biotin carboxyl carrier protein [Chloroflexales bacterium]